MPRLGADADVAGNGTDPLYQMGARAYAPHLGTFTTLDTYAGRAQDPISLNRYLYAHANPATLIDPSGHSVQKGPCGPDGQACDQGGYNPDGGPQFQNPNAPVIEPVGGGTSSTGGSDSGGATEPTRTVTLRNPDRDDPFISVASNTWLVYALWLSGLERKPGCSNQIDRWLGACSDPAGSVVDSITLQMLPLLGDWYQSEIIRTGYDPIAGVHLTYRERQDSAFLMMASAGIVPVVAAGYSRAMDAGDMDNLISAAGRSGDDIARSIGRITEAQAAAMTQEQLTALVSVIAQREAGRGGTWLDENMLTPGQVAAADKEPWLRPMYRGTAVHQLTDNALAQIFGRGGVQYDSNGPVDFLFPANGLRVELTTELAVPGHVRRITNAGIDIQAEHIATYPSIK